MLMNTYEYCLWALNQLEGVLFCLSVCLHPSYSNQDLKVSTDVLDHEGTLKMETISQDDRTERQRPESAIPPRHQHSPRSSTPRQH